MGLTDLSLWTLTIPFTAGVLVAFMMVAILGRAPIRFFTPIFRLVSIPFRPLIKAARALRLLPRSARRIQVARTAAVSAAMSVERRLQHHSEVEIALRIPDEDMLTEMGENAQPYDFKEEKNHLRKDGLFLRSMQINSKYLPELLTMPMSDRIADEYISEAKRFFNRKINLQSNERALYEDVEGAFIISLFRKSDRLAFYVLNEMRKTINGNARRMILIFTFLLSAVLFSVLFGIGPNLPMAIGALVVTALIMIIWHNAGYQKQQQHNSRELRSFLTRYLGRISDRYREATGIARGVTVGDETDSKKLAEDARKWHKIMVWMPFRTFFIESFVRSLLYQVNRNCSYYLLIPPIAVILLCITTGVLFQQGVVDVTPYLSPAGGMIGLTFMAVILVYLERINKVVIAEELSQLDWLGFEDLNISDAMDDVVGKYAEDVGFWKRRLDR